MHEINQPLAAAANYARACVRIARAGMLATSENPREVDRYEVGCNSYVIKPFAYDEFSETVKRLGQFLQVIRVSSQVGATVAGK